MLGLVKHVEGHYHAHVHVDELSGEIKVTLQVAGVDDVNHHIGGLLRELPPHIEFLGTVGRETVGAGQVDQLEVVVLEVGIARLGIHCHSRVVAHALVGTAGKVEERGLSAVGIAHQGHIDGVAFLLGGFSELLGSECLFIGVRSIDFY